MKNIFKITNTQKILDYVLDFPFQDFIEAELVKEIKISKSGVNYALKDLVEAKLLLREKRGKINFYKLNTESLIVPQLKILKTEILLDSLFEEIKPYCSKIILFGSCAQGSNADESDIDLFIRTEEPERVRKITTKYKMELNLQAIIEDNKEFLLTKEKEPVFYEQVKKGIVLWEGKADYEKF